MGRMYSAIFENVTIAAVQDLFTIVMGGNVHAIIHSLYLGQITLTAQEILEIKATRASTTGSGGTTANKRGLDPSMPASDATVDINDTSQGTPGDIVLERVWNVLVPFEYLPTPETRIHVPGGGRLIFELETTPTSMTAYGELVWEELG